MDLLSTILFLVFIVAPAVTIYAFVSRLGSGVYHWADRQHYPQEPIQVHVHTHETIETIERIERIERKSESADNPLDSYLGHKTSWEDSEEYKRWLDKQSFDVRNYL